MLFNSYVFIFAFLPLVLVGYYLLASRMGMKWALFWLILASLFFYGWWNPIYLTLILVSIVFNYAISKRIEGKRNRHLLTLGIAVNLGLLAYFKYANFFVDNLNTLFEAGLVLETVILPLAISFFTFQQIAFLVDTYRQESHAYSFLNYSLFVCFFPQLIAGPIVHHRQMMPQFASPSLLNERSRNIAIGFSIFAIGLFKKVVIADSIAAYSTPLFSAAEQGDTLNFYEAWCAALAYTGQLYFDFSGYSDMAIGLGRMFGIRLPLNFNSPYKSGSIIEFWKRWHITLSTFLRDYLYIPLGGNRKGPARRYVNLIITMLLGGLWHGAGWLFVIWGLLHGVYLVINHAWRNLRSDISLRVTGLERSFYHLLTFLAVVVAWVFFRAESLDSAWSILQSMFSAGFLRQEFHSDQVDLSMAFILIPIVILIAWFAPNSQEMMAQDQSSGQDASADRVWLRWRPSAYFACACSLAVLVSLSMMQGNSEFLYFQF
ncbi:MAG: membrane-bound O-acyltransferase family protein [Oleiphilus sp.]|nr:MAG: membrane-bound O-acyltransferase family protein [Oleiphilus sp.]